MPIIGIIDSQKSGHLYSYTPNYYSIATQTIGAGGASSVTFSSIPSTYTHLQIRGIGKSSYGVVAITPRLKLNNDATTTDYKLHYLGGDGSSPTSGAESNPPYTMIEAGSGGNYSQTFGATVIDILDYANGNKNKVIRNLAGYDDNGNGQVYFFSGVWLNTTTVNSITIYDTVGNFVQGSQFALYGVL
jgi:hypothetical protein